MVMELKDDVIWCVGSGVFYWVKSVFEDNYKFWKGQNLDLHEPVTSTKTLWSNNITLCARADALWD